MKLFAASAFGFLMSGWVPVCPAQTGSLLQRAPAQAALLKNPYEGNESSAKAGAKLYRQECAACHGHRAEGSHKAPPLNRLDVQNASPGALFWVLRNGALRRGMPSFAHLPEPERWQIVTYLQSLRRSAEAFERK